MFLKVLPRHSDGTIALHGDALKPKTRKKGALPDRNTFGRLFSDVKFKQFACAQAALAGIRVRHHLSERKETSVCAPKPQTCAVFVAKVQLFFARHGNRCATGSYKNPADRMSADRKKGILSAADAPDVLPGKGHPVRPQ